MPHAMTTPWYLDAWADFAPSKLALIESGTGAQLTYRGLQEASVKAAAAMADAGVAAHDVVAYLLSEPITTIVALFAVNRLGAAWMPLNPRLWPADWRRQLRHADSCAVLVDGDTSSAAPLAAEGQTLRLIPVAGFAGSAGKAGLGSQGAADDDLAGLLYTSGTTGEPKGARHSHRTLWGWNYSLTTSLGLQSADRILNPYPLYHMGGIGFTLAALQIGATAILATPFDPQNLAAALRSYRPSVAFMVPTMVQALLDHPEARTAMADGPLSHLVVTSAPLMGRTRRMIHEAWPRLKTTVLYSATEAVFSLGPVGSEDFGVGVPAFGHEMAVLDEQGKICPPGQLGRLAVRGVSVFAGYHRQANPPGGADPGWFCAGDVGFQDAGGMFHLVDREKDLINSGGEKISSVEIENRLKLHPAVDDVAVVGIPDPYWGERIHAVVVLRPGLAPESLEAFARRVLPSYKVPKSWSYCRSLPKTETGKILKRMLREEISRVPERARVSPAREDPQ
ncbi:MAG: class I adenylate-forming enzyme family protein [Firmicutes bacterium]|nr:class I adenylate-forming enzyme family protein [Bacillota bacterium]